jgi:hypothetical protein
MGKSDQSQTNKGRWKKSRGDRRLGKDKSLDIRAIIEKSWSKRVVIKQNGARRRVTRFEAIMLQLSAKAMGGSKRAHRVLMKYVAFIAARYGKPDVEIQFSE